jgi:hypothetical protein
MLLTEKYGNLTSHEAIPFHILRILCVSISIKGVFGLPLLKFSPYHIECLNLRSGY